MFEIGNTLREARLRRGLDILDCEAETKIRAKYLRAMEEEQFDLMPSPTYVRGFLKSYAEFLDLDGQLVLDEYESRFGDYDAPHEYPVRTAREPRESRFDGRPPRRPGPSQRRHRRRRRTELQLLWLAIGGVIAVALLIWLGVGEGDSPTPSPADTPAAAPGPSAAASAAPVEPDTASEEGPVRVKKMPIVLTGSGTIGSWVQVRGGDETGRVVYEAILEPGAARTFKVLEGIWVRAANPSELVVTVNGRPVELGATSTANFEITREGAEVVG
jgi:Helix-turn-helix domain/RodZ C-terminal domain